MEVAPSTEITFDLYGKLCGFSSKFKELFNKAKEENPSIAYASSGSMPASIYDTPVSPPVHSKYCGNCGAEISGQGNFCESCGASVIVKV
jgi:hypothetical protein